jgi:Periplasmic binding protein
MPPGRLRRNTDRAFTDTEIKIGQTIAYSGPASSFGTTGHTTSAYYRMINDRGGVNDRKINFISADDGYSPPKTVERTRRFVEQDQVLAIIGSLGSPSKLMLSLLGAKTWGSGSPQNGRGRRPPSSPAGGRGVPSTVG